MTETLRLGHLAGVRVGLHWSVLGIVVIVAVGLASTLLPEQFPGYATWAYVVAAVLTALAFVGSLLAHELGHAVVAMRHGITVEGITLWLLGGVANLRDDAKTPAVDFRIAAIGPAISFALGLVFAAAAWIWATAGLFELGAGVLAYLGGINVLLAVFNLIPAAPLDGGRVLRSLIWHWRGDRLTAQVWAARAGRGFGFVLIVLGVGQLFGGYVGGLWWVLIGLFVVTMAGAEEHHSRMGSALDGVLVRDVMTPDPDTADSTATVADFIHEVALVRRHSAFPVVEPGGRVIGMITLNRVRDVEPDQRTTKRLAEVACPPAELPVADPDEPLTSLLPRLSGCADGRALVLEGGTLESGRLLGIVAPSDVNRAVAFGQLGVRSSASGERRSQLS